MTSPKAQKKRKVKAWAVVFPKIDIYWESSTMGFHSIFPQKMMANRYAFINGGKVVPVEITYTP